MEDWRRIDIDALEPDTHLSAEDLIPQLPPVSYEQIQQVSQQVRSSLSSGQFVVALQLALDNPPYVADAKTKELHGETLFEILCSIKNNHHPNDYKQIISQLSQQQQDTLVKYLYRAMSTPYGAKQGGLILTWFEKTVELTGLGPIVRFITDRRTVWVASR